MIYVLPKVNISYKEGVSLYPTTRNSLQYYLNTFQPTTEIENKIVTLSKYKPKSNSFFVMLELLHSNRIPDTTEIKYVGSDACIEAFDWISTNEDWEYWFNFHLKEPETKKLKDTIVESVINQFKQRSEVGINKYGVTLDRTDLTMLEWLKHLQEELMDATLYIEKLKSKLNFKL
jgi:hypothetical protein